MLTQRPNLPEKILTPRIEKMSHLIMQTRKTFPMEGIAFNKASTTTLIDWHLDKALNGRMALSVLKTLRLEKLAPLVPPPGSSLLTFISNGLNLCDKIEIQTIAKSVKHQAFVK